LVVLDLLDHRDQCRRRRLDPGGPVIDHYVRALRHHADASVSRAKDQRYIVIAGAPAEFRLVRCSSNFLDQSIAYQRSYDLPGCGSGQLRRQHQSILPRRRERQHSAAGGR
jgi:hypothetical protein